MPNRATYEKTAQFYQKNYGEPLWDALVGEASINYGSAYDSGGWEGGIFQSKLDYLAQLVKKLG